MGRKKVPLVTGHTYHIYTKSISGYEIFNNEKEFGRMIAAFKYYQLNNTKLPFSYFLKLEEQHPSCNAIATLEEGIKLVKIIAYCLMSTHLHLILKQLEEKGISTFMNNSLNSYTHFFNAKHNRKGPLWEGRFKKILVETDEQLLHLTRYIHLNPTTSYLVEKPEDWPYSSYREYLSEMNNGDNLCDYKDILTITPETYKKFIEDRIDYQKELAKIKKLII